MIDFKYYRTSLLYHVNNSTDLCVALQKHRNPVLDTFFRLWTMAGDIAFYVCFIPFTQWILYPLNPQIINRYFMHEFSVLLFFMSLIGGIVKDVVNSPRPPANRVWRIKLEHDNGFPSSHSMNAVGLALFTLLEFWSQLGDWKPTALIVTVCWCVFVPLSRFYNGVHSWPDVVCGALMGVLAVLVFRIDGVAEAARTAPGAILAIILSIIHPRPPTVTASRAWCLSLLIVGVYAASWLDQLPALESYRSSSIGLPLALASLATDACDVTALAVYRLVVAFVVLGGYVALTTVVGRAMFPPRQHVSQQTKREWMYVLPTAAYKALSPEAQKLVIDELARTRHRPLVAVLLPIAVFFVIPRVLPAFC